MKRSKIALCRIPESVVLERLVRELYALGYRRDGLMNVEMGIAGINEAIRGGYVYIYVENGEIRCGAAYRGEETDIHTIVNSPRHLIDYLKRGARQTT